MEHPVTALLVGDATESFVAPLQHAQEQGWRFRHAPDVYAATALLLRPDPVRPIVVLVLVESLRGDELRFFDLLSRRWSTLPAVAVYAASAQDRRLEACRRRGVTVLSAQDLPHWLTAQQPALDEPLPAAACDQPGDPAVAGPSPSSESPTPVAETRPPSPGATGGQAPSQAIVQLPPSLSPAVPPAEPLCGIEIELDLPDELADLPDFDEMQAELASPADYGPEDLPDELEDDLPPAEEDLPADQAHEQPDERDEQSAADELDAPDEQANEDLPDQVPLTPWSSVPRVERRPPRKPPASPRSNGPQVAPSSPQGKSPPAPAGPSSSPLPGIRNPGPPARPSSQAPRHWEDGLLTPEELRALLQEPDDLAAPGETKP